MSTTPQQETHAPIVQETPQRDPFAVIMQLAPPACNVFSEYLEGPFPFGEVLEHKLATLRQSILDELALYFDIRGSGTQIELYFKKEQ